MVRMVIGMSKADQLRALREANWAARQKVPPKPAKAAKVAVPSQDSLCGHRAIGGKSCVRPLGHTEKSHRYGST